MIPQPNCPHFHAGKQARSEGKACVIADGRMKPESRQSWYDGWNYQNNLMMPKPTEEEVQDSADFLKKLSASLRA